MTMSLYCPGPKQDDTGTWYCPRDPYLDEFDCAKCQDEYDQWVDRAIDAEQERESWG
jgi:hypothetical protein